MTEKIRVLIADDHAIVRMGLTSILETQPDISVVGEAEDGNEAISKAAECKPDVILMDLMMPVLDGVSATSQIHESFPDIKILLLTSYGSADGIAHALEAGASGAIMKNIKYTELIKTIRTTVHGKRVISPTIKRALKESPPIPELTERQKQILQSIVRGLTDADIALELGLSTRGIRDHITTIFAKLGAANRAEAVAIAMRKHLLKI